MGNQWSSDSVSQYSVYLRFCENKAMILCLILSAGNPKEDELANQLLIVNGVRSSPGNSLQYLICLKSKCE